MPTEWIIVLVIGLLLLFSAKKLPDMARGLGQSMRIFKAETRGMREDDQARTKDAQPAIGESAPGQATTQAVPQAQPAQDQPVAQPVQAQPAQARPVQAPVAQPVAQPAQAQPDPGTVAPATPTQPGSASTS